MKGIYRKNTVLNYLYLTLSLFISAASYNLFIRSFNIVAGGTGGVAIILEHLFGIDNAVSIFLLSMILVIISLLFLGVKESIAGFYIAIVYPIFVYVTSFLINVINIGNQHILIAVLFGGIISGIATGMNYKTGFNTGGFGIIAKIIANKRYKSESFVNLMINSIVIFIGALMFGFEMVLYSVVIIYVSTLVSNKIFIGISNNKLFYIISDKYKEIMEFTINDFRHDITMYDVKGEYLGASKKMLMVVVPNSEYFIFKNSLKEIDKNAFVFVSDSYETRKQDVFINKY